MDHHGWIVETSTLNSVRRLPTLRKGASKLKEVIFDFRDIAVRHLHHLSSLFRVQSSRSHQPQHTFTLH